MQVIGLSSSVSSGGVVPARSQEVATDSTTPLFSDDVIAKIANAVTAKISGTPVTSPCNEASVDKPLYSHQTATTAEVEAKGKTPFVQIWKSLQATVVKINGITYHIKLTSRPDSEFGTVEYIDIRRVLRGRAKSVQYSSEEGICFSADFVGDLITALEELDNKLKIDSFFQFPPNKSRFVAFQSKVDCFKSYLMVEGILLSSDNHLLSLSQIKDTRGNSKKTAITFPLREGVKPIINRLKILQEKVPTNVSDDSD